MRNTEKGNSKRYLMFATSSPAILPDICIWCCFITPVICASLPGQFTPVYNQCVCSDDTPALPEY